MWQTGVVLVYSSLNENACLCAIKVLAHCQSTIEAFFEANKKLRVERGVCTQRGKIGQFLSLGSDKLSFFFSPHIFCGFFF